MSKLVALMDQSDGWCYDTYDTRVGPAYRMLARNRDHRAAVVALHGLYAIELLAPLLYRRLRGIPKSWDPMGNSYRAGVELTLYQLDGAQRHLERARAILDRVAACATGDPGRRGFALGFPCVTGSNRLWKTTVPVAHYTLRVLRKFLIWERVRQDRTYRAAIAEGIEFFLNGLAWVERDGVVGVAYTPEDPLHVINIWADVAAVLAAYDRQCGDARCRSRALALVDGVVDHQRSDGGWPYFARWERMAGDEDNTHTAMVLGALADIALCYPEQRGRLASVLEKGVERWVGAFFDEASGRHWNLIARPQQVFTVCLGDALYAINRLLRPAVGLAESTRERLRRLEERVVSWSLQHLLLRSGRFCERRLPYKRYHLQSIRSFDGLTCDALALYIARRQLGDNTVLWAC